VLIDIYVREMRSIMTPALPNSFHFDDFECVSRQPIIDEDR